MYIHLLVELNQKEKDLDKLKKTIDNLMQGAELKRYKDEYLRLKEILEKDEQNVHSCEAQIEIKNKEISNLLLEKENCEILKKSSAISAKKIEKVEEQVKKLHEKVSNADTLIVKLNKEAETAKNNENELKRKMHFVRKKYTDIKAQKQEQLNKLSEEEKRLLEHIKGLYEKIDKEIIELYSKVKNIHVNPISNVENKICKGCNMEISSLNYEAARHLDKITRCENCGRILLVNIN